ncbi:MAG: Mitochondrial beta-keto-acyl synthase [Alectoria fallacina]|uniref:Mitochondrial beta-keto-acyl synthase n=1 Tax=Alectoria fallacina TaxID=1903189 RepID=A0A8H3HVP0_9LECA|nr:MAG: Mitochondrial beta-keto-acyl synthase [Alectoria fallacina]
MSLVDPGAGKNSLSKKEKPTGGVKLKKSIAKKTKPKDTETKGTKTGGTTRSPSPDSPAVNGTGPKAGDIRGLTKCNYCKNTLPESAVTSHAKLCDKRKEVNRKKKEAKEAKAKDAKAKEAAEDKDKDGDSIMGESITASQRENETGEGGNGSTKKPPKKSASKASVDGPKKSKKRKADGEGDKEPKKKKLKKDEPPKPKLPKPKGPVNVEKQCGVMLPNGGFCARSLTCKSHSMGAKRSVPGRSLPYDQLLAMYQKQNQAKIQKAALEAKAPLLDDGPPEGPVDSDEEKDAVMAAIARVRPTPLDQHVFVPTARKYKHIRMKEMLGNALGSRGSGGGGLFGAGNREQVISDGAMPGPVVSTASENMNGEGPSRKPSLAQQAQGKAAGGGAAVAPVRKASVASAGNA